MHRLCLIAVVLLLAACEGDPDFDALFGGGSDRITVARGEVVIAGPLGYCPDRTATQGPDRQVSVVLGSCASIRNSAQAPSPVIPAVLTASVSRENGADISGSFSQLERFFRSRSGRAALARNGDSRSVRLLSMRRRNGAFIMRLEDRSPNRVPGLSAKYWRALIDVKGRIITLSVIAFEAKPMSDAFARATLDGFINRVRQENAPPASEN